MSEPKRAWKFALEDFDSVIDHYRVDGEEYVFIGTRAEANREAERVSDLLEDTTGRFVAHVTIESQGVVR